MRKIGIDKRDPSYRHFYYDDSKVLTSNPPKYEVHYVDDESDIDYVECSCVIKIKDAPTEDDLNQKLTKIEIDSNHDGKKDITITSDAADVSNVLDNIINNDSNEQKKRGRKKKVVDETKVILDKKQKNEDKVSIDFSTLLNVKFEYRIFDIDFSSSSELTDLLNKYGNDGWELCGTELYNEGLIFDKKKIFCVMKKIKCFG